LLRILHVVPSYIPAWRYGGPIHSVHGLCKALAARGHDVDVATTNVDGDSNSDVPVGVPVALDGVRVHYFPSKVLRRLYYSPPLYRFMTAQGRKWDLIHTHSVFLWPTTAAAHVARKTRTPYVVSPRGMLVRDLIDRRSPLLKKSWIQLFERRNIELAAGVHVTSAVEGNALLAMGLKPRRMFEIPNGFDLPAPSDQAITPRKAVPESYALFLGRISWKKGLDRLIAALAKAPDVNLVVAGNDDEGYWPKMVKLAEELAVIDRIYYVGFVEGEDKRALISSAAMMVLPSYSENFGNAVLEAMALGVPVIVTPEVGLASVVESTRSGIVVDGDPGAFGEAMGALHADTDRRRALGQSARVAAEAFSWNGVAEKFEREYLALLR